MTDESELARHTDLLSEVVDDLSRDRTERTRANRITAAAAILALFLSLVDVAALGVLLVNSRDIQRAPERNTKALVTNAIPKPSTGLTKNGLAIVIEIDCRNRRAIAHLSPPPAGKSCVLP